MGCGYRFTFARVAAVLEKLIVYRISGYSCKLKLVLRKRLKHRFRASLRCLA
jgi:hypothetical protein